MRWLLLIGFLTFVGFLSFLRHVSVANKSAPSTREASTTNWLAYSNARFEFEFSYPADLELTADPDAEMPGDPGAASDVVVGPAFTVLDRLPEEFEIIAFPKRSETEDIYGDPPGFWRSSMLQLVPEIHEMMMEEQQVGTISTTTIAGEEAFEFTVTNGIGWNGSGRAVDEQNDLVFLENTSTIFQISFPNIAPFDDILPTFELTSGSGG
jgi:hypothetical protein